MNVLTVPPPLSSVCHRDIWNSRKAEIEAASESPASSYFSQGSWAIQSLRYRKSSVGEAVTLWVRKREAAIIVEDAIS